MIAITRSTSFAKDEGNRGQCQSNVRPSLRTVLVVVRIYFLECSYSSDFHNLKLSDINLIFEMGPMSLLLVYSQDIVSEFEKTSRTIEGLSDEVYKIAAKQASKISLSLSSKFNDEWQKTLVNLLNKPSKNKSILNLGLYKNNNYGI